MKGNSGTAAFFRLARQGEKGGVWFFFLWIIFLTLLVLILKNHQKELLKITKSCDLYFSNGVVLQNIPIAETLEQQHHGLSQKTSAGQGLLFSWQEPAQRVFWMKDTFIPLTVGFFDENGFLFETKDMQPNTKEYHYSTKPAIDALELPQGQFEKFKLTVGVKLIKKTVKENE